MTTHNHMQKYDTVREAIDAVAGCKASGISAGLKFREAVSYVTDGRGTVTRVLHYCNTDLGGNSKITHRERIVRHGPREAG